MITPIKKKTPLKTVKWRTNFSSKPHSIARVLLYCFNEKINLDRLRFAASQWQQLVSNAESLLNELVAKGSLAGDTQNRIRSWLCLKEEYQHCIDPELYAMKPRIKNQTDPNGNHSINAQHSVLGLPRTTDSKTLHVIGN